MLSRAEPTRVYPPPPPSTTPLLPLAAPRPYSDFSSFSSWASRVPSRLRQPSGSAFPGPPPPAAPPPPFPAPFLPPFPTLRPPFPAIRPLGRPVPPPPNSRRNRRDKPFPVPNQGRPSGFTRGDNGLGAPPASLLPPSPLPTVVQCVGPPPTETAASGRRRLGTLGAAGPENEACLPRVPGADAALSESRTRGRSLMSAVGVPEGDASHRAATAKGAVNRHDKKPAGTVNGWRRSRSGERLETRDGNGRDASRARPREADDCGNPGARGEARQRPDSFSVRRLACPSASKSRDGDPRHCAYAPDAGDSGRALSQSSVGFPRGQGLSRGDARDVALASSSSSRELRRLSGEGGLCDAVSSPRLLSCFAGRREFSAGPSAGSGEGDLHADLHRGPQGFRPPAAAFYAAGPGDGRAGSRSKGESPCHDAYPRQHPVSFFDRGLEPQGSLRGAYPSWGSADPSPRRRSARASSADDPGETGRRAGDDEAFCWASASLSAAYEKSTHLSSDVSVATWSGDPRFSTLCRAESWSGSANAPATTAARVTSFMPPLGFHAFPAILGAACRTADDDDGETSMVIDDGDGETAMVIEDEEMHAPRLSAESVDASKGTEDQSNFRSLSTSDTLVLESFSPTMRHETVTGRSVNIRGKRQGKKSEQERPPAFSRGSNVTVAAYADLSSAPQTQVCLRSFSEKQQEAQRVTHDREVRLSGSRREDEDGGFCPSGRQADPTGRRDTGSGGRGASTGVSVCLSRLPAGDSGSESGVKGGDASWFEGPEETATTPGSDESGTRSVPRAPCLMATGPAGKGDRREETRAHGEGGEAEPARLSAAREKTAKKRRKSARPEWREEGAETPSAGRVALTAREAQQVRGLPPLLQRFSPEENGRPAAFNASQAARAALDRVEACIQRDAQQRLQASTVLRPGADPGRRGSDGGRDAPGDGPGDRRGAERRGASSSVGAASGRDTEPAPVEKEASGRWEEELTASAPDQRAESHRDRVAFPSQQPSEGDGGQERSARPGSERERDVSVSFERPANRWSKTCEHGLNGHIPSAEPQKPVRCVASSERYPGTGPPPAPEASLSDSVFRGSSSRRYELLPVHVTPHHPSFASCTSGRPRDASLPKAPTSPAFPAVRILRLKKDSRSPSLEKAEATRVRDRREQDEHRGLASGGPTVAASHRWRERRDSAARVPPGPSLRHPQAVSAALVQNPVSPSVQGRRGAEPRANAERDAGCEKDGGDSEKRRVTGFRGEVETREKAVSEMPVKNGEQKADTGSREPPLGTATGSSDSRACPSPGPSVCVASSVSASVSPLPSTPLSSVESPRSVDQAAGSVGVRAAEKAAPGEPGATERQERQASQTAGTQREAERSGRGLTSRDHRKAEGSAPLPATVGLLPLALTEMKSRNQQVDAPPAPATGDISAGGAATGQGRRSRWGIARARGSSAQAPESETAGDGGGTGSVQGGGEHLSSRSVDGDATCSEATAVRESPRADQVKSVGERTGGDTAGGAAKDAESGDSNATPATSRSRASGEDAIDTETARSPVDGEGRRSWESPTWSANEDQEAQKGDDGAVEGLALSRAAEVPSRDGAVPGSTKDGEVRANGEDECTEAEEKKGQRPVDSREADGGEAASQSEREGRKLLDQERTTASFLPCSSPSPPSPSPDPSSGSSSVRHPSQGEAAGNKPRSLSLSPHAHATPALASSPPLSPPLSPSAFGSSSSVSDSTAASLSRTRSIEAPPAQESSDADTSVGSDAVDEGVRPVFAGAPPKKGGTAPVRSHVAEKPSAKIVNLPALAARDAAQGRSPGEANSSSEKDSSPRSVFPWRAFQSPVVFFAASPASGGPRGRGESAEMAPAPERQQREVQGEETGDATGPRRAGAPRGQKRETKSGVQTASPARKRKKPRRLSSLSASESLPESPGQGQAVARPSGPAAGPSKLAAPHLLAPLVRQNPRLLRLPQTSI
ncbi:conserved hypothetical protein [Neospora caninum Liverpool]|uniref:Uncharacterized protein n=1 Tax=Neospora caninum (strain Liverpool) TaxID=572307 RepID=F0V846_NEOCL|nr:conserved hypothetical protein [Neospora caninum Liverpool]CBZ49887.1 conserved hypothetical protein [Neospora caninum Liverpool]|eukprot:XP_003879922.1 conserved hypothetical protein [Neospora caninum Liverpool]